MSRGCRGDALRTMLLQDKGYQALLKKRKQKLTQQVPLTRIESKKYVMSVDEDYEILSKVKQLEQCDLLKEEKFLITFIRTQLEHDWRKWLIQELNRLLSKYKIDA